MIVINDSDIPDNLDYRVLSRELRYQFLSLSLGTSKVLYRKRLEAKRGILDVMGGIDEENRVGVVKQYFYGTQINFLVSLFSTENSDILAIFPGKKLTRIRTAAASALATDILSRSDSKVLGCIGAGYQAEEQIRAISQIRNVKRVLIDDINIERAQHFKNMIGEELGIEVEIYESVNEDFKDADIIITATTSLNPVIGDEFIGENCYINSIGSYTPEMRETELTTICKSRIIAVDSIEETSTSAGEVIDALSSGCIERNQINEFTDLVSGNIRKRASSERKNGYFKSIGVGIEDLAVARYLYSHFSFKG
ncbi:MAG: ornithine cyclodeaminase family protein [Thermoplasmatales archaeon]